MSRRSDTRASIDDFAAGLTDRALGIARQAGIDGDSVAIELRLWESLRDQLEHELGLYQWVRYGEPVPFGGTLHQILHRAVLAVAQEHDPFRSLGELESAIRPLVADVRFLAAEQNELERLFPSREPTRWLGRSGIMRRLQFVALT